MGEKAVAPQIEERLRRRRQEVVRRNGRKRLALLAGAALVLIILVAWWWLTHSPSMSVREIRVPVLSHVTSAQLEDALSGARGINLLRLDVDPVEGKLRSIPYVREAYVHKLYPHGLEVEIVEYEPFALARPPSGYGWLVAEDGRILQKAEAQGAGTPRAPAPPEPRLELQSEGGLVEGGFLTSEVAASLQVLSLVRGDPYWSATHPVACMKVTDVGRATLVLKGGAEVRLGNDGQWENKLHVAGQIIDRYLAQGESLEYVDVQAPGRAVAKAREAE